MRFSALLFCLLPAMALCQGAKPGGDDPKVARPAASALLDVLKPRSLGPTSMGGRISDLAVYDRDPRIFYVASASGGLFKTENGGMSLQPVFEREGTISLGAVAIFGGNPNVVWVGTGEGNVRNSVSWGDGVYRSEDGGKTWTNVGLRDTKHISRIVLHPTNGKIAYVAAQGHVWGFNEERGIFKTDDGGKSWKKVLYVDEKTGFADVQMDPKRPDTLLAASWQRLRKPYNFVSGGPGSALWKTTDGGKTWRKITRGLPPSPMGRIGITYYPKDPKIVIATVERPPVDPIERPVSGEVSGGVFRSVDGGETWVRTTLLNPRPFYFSRPVYDPSDPNRVYVLGIDLHASDDGGRSFRSLDVGIHSDHHAMWVNPNDSSHILDGNDGGLYETRDRGKTWRMLDSMAIGQYYMASFDMRKPYWVYGGLQDNGQWTGPTQSVKGAVRADDFYSLGGGDGFYVLPDPADWTTVYWESQGGSLSRLNQKTGDGQGIVPLPPPGERYRFNWSAPLIASPHNAQTLYFGGNKLFKSVNRGGSWKPVSPDLTTNDPSKQRPGEGSVSPESTSAENHCTIVTISESPRRQGVLWVGTDDGLIQVSQDDGLTWCNVTPMVPDLPMNTWCSRVTASRFEDGRAYATFDGHRNDDYKAYVYCTEDFGKSWKKLGAELPDGDSCYVLREGVQNPNLLLLGTEMSLWVSLDRGAKWMRYRAPGFPTVAVHDVAIHPREQDAILATHGRSIWIVPVSPLEQLSPDNLAKDVFLCKPAPTYLLGRIQSSSWYDSPDFRSPNTQPSATVYYHLKEGSKAAPVVEISDAAGRVVFTKSGSQTAGLNSVVWNFQAQGFGARFAAGDYRVALKVDGKEYLTSLKVEDLTDELHR